jgi:hypothetical protein
VVIEHDIRRGAVVALTMALAATDMDLQDVEGFLEGFELAANVIAAMVHADQVLNEDP